MANGMVQFLDYGQFEIIDSGLLRAVSGAQSVTVGPVTVYAEPLPAGVMVAGVGSVTKDAADGYAFSANAGPAHLHGSNHDYTDMACGDVAGVAVSSHVGSPFSGNWACMSAGPASVAATHYWQTGDQALYVALSGTNAFCIDNIACGSNLTCGSVRVGAIYVNGYPIQNAVLNPFCPSQGQIVNTSC